MGSLRSYGVRATYLHTTSYFLIDHHFSLFLLRALLFSVNCGKQRKEDCGPVISGCPLLPCLENGTYSSEDTELALWDIEQRTALPMSQGPDMCD